VENPKRNYFFKRYSTGEKKFKDLKRQSLVAAIAWHSSDDEEKVSDSDSPHVVIQASGEIEKQSSDNTKGVEIIDKSVVRPSSSLVIN